MRATEFVARKTRSYRFTSYEPGHCNLPGKNRVLCQLSYRLDVCDWQARNGWTRCVRLSALRASVERSSAGLEAAVFAVGPLAYFGSAPWIRTTIPRFKVSCLALRRAPNFIWRKVVELNHSLEGFNFALIHLSYPCEKQRARCSPGFRLPALESGLVAAPVHRAEGLVVPLRFELRSSAL